MAHYRCEYCGEFDCTKRHLPGEKKYIPTPRPPAPAADPAPYYGPPFHANKTRKKPANTTWRWLDKAATGTVDKTAWHVLEVTKTEIKTIFSGTEETALQEWERLHKKDRKRFYLLRNITGAVEEITFFRQREKHDI